MINNDTGLDQLRLSKRVRRFLSNYDIRTVNQLCSLSSNEVLMSSDMDSADVAQIAGELNRIGRTWPSELSISPSDYRHNATSLRLHALFAASEGDTVELELTVADQPVTRFDLLGLFRAEAEEYEPACRAKHLRYSANDLRRIADLLDQLASAEPSEA